MNSQCKNNDHTAGYFLDQAGGSGCHQTEGVVQWGRGEFRVGDCWSLIERPGMLGSLGESEVRVGDCWSLVGRPGVLGPLGESEIRVGDCWSLVERPGLFGVFRGV